MSIEIRESADQANKDLSTLDVADDMTESSVIKRAVEVIGDKAEAMRWLGTPVYALGYETPVSRLHTPAGRESVMTVLGRLEHGIS